MTNITSETKTENIFRDFYGSTTFMEKSAIPTAYGFKSKKGTDYKGYPDFFIDLENFTIIVEAKALLHTNAIEEVQFYMLHNNISKDIIGIAVSGQNKKALKVSYFLKKAENNDIIEFKTKNVLLSFKDIDKIYRKEKYGEMTSTENLVLVLKKLNKQFNNDSKVRDTDRSLFFSGLMIALTNNNFRSTYKGIQSPSKEEVVGKQVKILEAHNLNEAILNAIAIQLESKINNLSKEYSWRDKFSFIKNIDYSLIEYKEIITTIENKIFRPFQNDEKQDILGRAYKIFLSRAGKVDNKNIILTPDHIKSLMVKLARLNQSDVVLDTCTGSGGFLMESMETMIELAKGDPNKIKNIRENQLIGFETDSVLFALACSNMFLHGDGRTNLIYRSSLLESKSQGSVINSSDEELLSYIKSYKPTKIIINPPYENNNPIKFALQAIEYLEPNGKLIVIMPTPTLTHNQNGLTEKLLEEAKLDFVIKMPTKLFTEQKRTVNTSIFGFTKTPQKQDDEVLFYNLEDDGFVSIQHKGRIDKNKGWPNLEQHVFESVSNAREIEGISQKKKIYKDGILNCAGIQKKRTSAYEMVKIGTLFDIEQGSLQSEKNEDGEYDFITASAEWKKHNTYTHECEAIIFAFGAGGSLGRTHYVNGKFIASNLCFILTPKNDSGYEINMQFYNCYFAAIRNQLVSDLADGTSKLTIGDTDLKEYYIDYIPYEKQKKFVKDSLTEVNNLKKQLAEAETKLHDHILKLV
ncbi:MAG: N-6 DNA methylase [Clostridia bacterium]|nr:N-6 DNA methylase [Clostridia bacterium]